MKIRAPRATLAALLLCAQSGCPVDTPAPGELSFLCSGEQDCSAGYRCDLASRTCVSGDAGTSARTDAAPGDTLAGDALNVDARESDLPSLDSARSDAARVDAPLPDTLSPDTLLPDTLLPDTSLPDTSPPPPSCADGSVEQVFAEDMIGCAGAVEFPDRATLCSPGWDVCPAAEWVARRADQVPTHNYWTDDPLQWAGSGSYDCRVIFTGGNSCSPASSPMRVCVDRSDHFDPEGNYCNWIACGFQQNAPIEYFGGCNSNLSAGTLCCR